MDGVAPDGVFATLRQSRRALLVALAASGANLAGVPALAARKKHGNKRKRRQKVRKNALGCVNAGTFCKRGSQCCSGICSGKKQKKTCRAHDASTCQLSQDICLNGYAICTTTAGAPGVCTITTGAASFCSTVAVCAECTRDADCVPMFGSGAACIVCAAECGGKTPNATMCASPTAPPP